MTRQQLLYVAEWEQPEEYGGMVPRAKPIKLAEKPDRVWTLARQFVPPPLPIEPMHGLNAFSEDCGHDWNWRDGVLRYFSRVADRPVWLLLEYDQ